MHSHKKRLFLRLQSQRFIECKIKDFLRFKLIFERFEGFFIFLVGITMGSMI